MKLSKVFAENVSGYNARMRWLVNQGSTRSGKTWALLQLLYIIAATTAQKLLISVVSETLPHLRRGAIRDFRQMLQDEGLWDPRAWRESDKMYTLPNGSQIEFFSADSPSKVLGPARDILFVNECNNIAYEIVRQLAVRTRKTIFLDFNPREEFWAHTEILPRTKGVKFIKSTYIDNPFLTPEQIQEIEANKHNKEWWLVYGLGEVGSREGLCLQNWDLVDTLPKEYKKRFFCLDFGFTNDPTALLEVRLSGGELYVKEHLYAQGLTNPEIAKQIKLLDAPDVPVVCDAAEPKSIEELRRFGVKRAEAAHKGPDSVRIGLEIINRYRTHITKSSLNLIKEARNYKYKRDMDGNPLNEPIDYFNHAIDAFRYGCLNYLNAGEANRDARGARATFRRAWDPRG